MFNKPKVSIIILNYNGCNHTTKCLESLEKIKYKNKEIILFNNGSTDNTKRVVKDKFPKVRLIEQKNNIGFCRGNNEAYKQAIGEYILFLNNDTLVTKNFLEPLVKKLDEDGKIGVIQPKIIFSKTDKLQSGCAFFTNTGFLYYFGYGKNPDLSKYNNAQNIYSANGACMLVRKKIIDKIGLFDEDYFSYVEETDFCHRVLLAGYKIWYEPKSVIYHLGGMDNSKYKQSALLYNSFRNRICTYLKNLEITNIILLLPVHLFFCLLVMAVYIFLLKFDNSWAMVRAIFSNVFHLGNTLKKRRVIQKEYRNIPDKEFLPIVTINPRLEYYFKLFTGLENYKD